MTTPRLRPFNLEIAFGSASLSIGEPFNSIVQGGPSTATISGAAELAASINSPIIQPPLYLRQVYVKPYHEVEHTFSGLHVA